MMLTPASQGEMSDSIPQIPRRAHEIHNLLGLDKPDAEQLADGADDPDFVARVVGDQPGNATKPDLLIPDGDTEPAIPTRNDIHDRPFCELITLTAALCSRGLTPINQS